MRISMKSPLSSLLDKEDSFMEMYRATALQRGKFFPSGGHGVYPSFTILFKNILLSSLLYVQDHIWLFFYILCSRLMHHIIIIEASRVSVCISVNIHSFDLFPRQSAGILELFVIYSRIIIIIIYAF